MENQTNKQITDKIQRLIVDAGNTAMKVKAIAIGIAAICNSQPNEIDSIIWLSQIAEEMAKQIDEKNQAAETLMFQLREQIPQH